jgi:hypothetical protein
LTGPDPPCHLTLLPPPFRPEQNLATGLTRIMAVGLSCGGGGEEALSEDTVRDWFRLKMLFQVK